MSVGARPSDRVTIDRLLREGVAWARRGHHERAAAAFEQAAKGAPDAPTRALAHRHLGEALHGAHRFADAIEPLRLAEHVLSHDTAIPATLALCLRELGRTREAIDACRRCLRIDPAMTGAIAMEIELLVRAGHDSEASERIADADRRGVRDENIDLAVGVLALRTGGRAEAAARLRHRLRPTDTGSGRQGMVRFTLGDLLDAEGRYDEAWEQYAAGNACGPDAFDPVRWETRVDRTLAAWSADAVRGLQRSGSASERPVFIVGMPRSGTTLAEMLLGRCRGVARAGELMDVSRLARTLTPGVDGSAVRRGAGAYLARLDEIDTGAPRVTDKMPLNFLHLGVVAAMFPHASIVHCRRDPRDTCLSCFTRFFHTEHLWTRRLDWLAPYFTQYERLMAHWAGVLRELGAPRMIEMRYEDATADPDAWARRLGEFAGLPWDGSGASNESERDAPTLRADQVGKGVYTTSVRRHEHYAAHLAPVCRALAASIDRYNAG